MEFDLINEIMSSTVGSLFRPQFSLTLDRKSEPTSVSASFTKVTTKSQTNTPLNISANISLQNLKKQRESSISSLEFPSTMDSDIEYSRDEQSMFKSSNHSVQKSLDLSGPSKKSLEENRQSLRELPNKQTQQPADIRPRSAQPVSTVNSVSQSLGSKEQSSITSQSKDIKPSKPAEVLTLDQWIAIEGPKKLDESLRKLKLDTSKINSANLNDLSYDDLQTQKRTVKNELKRYDSAFSSMFKRQPERREKEAMRPLYVYYKKLKQHISKAPGEEDGRRAEASNPTQPNRPVGNFFEGQNKQPQNGISNIISNNTSLNRSGRQPAPPLTINSNVSYTSSSRYSELDQQKKKLEELKVERSELRDRLHAYQSDFTKNHNRKIRYHKDIEPVEQEYKRYKDIKSEISELENKIQGQTN